MRSGDLRKRVTLQKRGTTQDAYGQQVTTWTDVCTFWASIDGLSARELLAAQAVHNEATRKVTVRYRPEFVDPIALAKMRLSYNGRIFNITGANNLDERNRQVELTVSEGMSNG